MGRRSLLAAVALFATILVADNARAHCLTTTEDPPEEYEPAASGCWKTGTTLAWPTTEIGVRLDPRASKKVPFDVAQRVVIESFAKWADVDCATFTVKHLEPAVVDTADCPSPACVVERLSGAGVIRFHDDAWPHANGESTFALTTTTFLPSSGRIYGAFMDINTADHDFAVASGSGATGLDYVVTHEAGHFLGIAHSDDGKALMFSRYRSDGGALLRDDDRAAACAVRPFVEKEKDKGCGCGVVTKSPPPAPLAALVLLLLHRRRRKLVSRRARC